MAIVGKKKGQRKDYCLIGLSKFNLEIGKILIQEDQSVTVIDSDPDAIDSWGPEFTNSINCDARDIRNLQDVGIADFDYVIVGIKDIEKSITICSNLKELEVGRILARAKDEVHKRILKLLGISYSIIPELYVVENLAYHTIFDLEVERLPCNKEEFQESDLFCARLPVYNQNLWGKPISSMIFLKENNSLILSIKRQKGGETIIPVSESDKLERSDTIFLIAQKNSISDLKNYFMKNVPVNLLIEESNTTNSSEPTN
ncbi:Trk system potassium uptake protein, TrkA [Mycoplasma wenyonii str. Massachusetts]|uniref:Trk system potassium uptake protein, TrkA n=1 Tax=Mycoplasma wenyonii (strain Massachusetts) TaxID=1197325 RepID=I6ZF20_MYCWM|nr:TrkA family potassium uptake protein [Mycoplasma wenyonii]AFN65212.1 Trk system potassium uptake protein, TrkA [Mycoplasma wenyonii str. Massachusetts]